MKLVLKGQIGRLAFMFIANFVFHSAAQAQRDPVPCTGDFFCEEDDNFFFNNSNDTPPPPPPPPPPLPPTPTPPNDSNSGSSNTVEHTLTCKPGQIANITDLGVGYKYVNLRAFSSPLSEKIGEIYDYEPVQILSVKLDGDLVKDPEISKHSRAWYQVEYNGLNGWISALYAKCSEATPPPPPPSDPSSIPSEACNGTVQIGNLSGDPFANLRSGPGTETSVVGKIPDAGRASVLSYKEQAGFVYDIDLGASSSAWYELEYQGTYGYVSALYTICDDRNPNDNGPDSRIGGDPQDPNDPDVGGCNPDSGNCQSDDDFIIITPN
jgi:hypothetical protein